MIALSAGKSPTYPSSAEEEQFRLDSIRVVFKRARERDGLNCLYR
jgi:hypothetical protein